MKNNFEFEMLRLKVEVMEMELKMLNLCDRIRDVERRNSRLKCEINGYKDELNLKENEMYVAGQPRYDGTKRVDLMEDFKEIRLNMFVLGEFMDIKGQIIKKRECKTIIFMDFLVNDEVYIIELFIDKKKYCINGKSNHNEYIKKSCKLGNIVQCYGMFIMKKGKIMFDVERVELLGKFQGRGFIPYKIPNKDDKRKILCNVTLKYCINNIEYGMKNVEVITKQCKVNKCQYRHKLNKNDLNKIMEQNKMRLKAIEYEFDKNDPYHNNKRNKSYRSKLFCEWLINNFGLDKINQCNVLDIAGGNGYLSILMAQYGINVTIIDPKTPTFVDKINGHKIIKKAYNKLNDKWKPKYLNKYFDNDILNDENILQLFNQCNVLVGLHPDEATESIFDLCLKYKKNFACLPCCVFPDLFPKKLNQNGNTINVRTYTQFIQYLTNKSNNIKTDYLAFKGRNKILYCKFN